tara:strand:+ start:12090 stop:12821 length:732 start_codon:yes stop_codon:yes gene_type:complete
MVRQVILDTETTGLDVETGHRVIEIGCVELISRKFTGKEYQTYLNPGRSVDEGAEKVHGLSNEFLGDKPSFNQVVDDFLDFIEGSELLIHNAAFDIGFLNHELKILKGEKVEITDYVESITDTLQLARQLHPGQKNSLDALVQRYNVSGYDRGYHGALLDSKILGEVYLALTGGQSAMNFNENVNKNLDDDDNQKPSDSLIGKKRPMIIKLDSEEEKTHIDYLKRMAQESQVEPVGLRDGELD